MLPKVGAPSLPASSRSKAGSTITIRGEMRDMVAVFGSYRHDPVQMTSRRRVLPEKFPRNGNRYYTISLSYCR